MNHFDPRHCDFDDEGYPHLRTHSCGRCGHTCQPAEQSLFTDDDGIPEGLVAMTPCPKCNAIMLSALGSPDFMEWVMEEEPFRPTESCVGLSLELAPIAAAVGRAH